MRRIRRSFGLASSVMLAAGFAAALAAPQAAHAALAAAPSSGTAVCGQAILDSPYTYTGASGSYTSGTAGLPTFGSAGTDFPNDTAGVVLPAETKDYQSFDLSPNTVYYLEPGTHFSSFEADSGDAFVGGKSGTTVTTVDGSSTKQGAFDSNPSNGNQPNVTIEYLTVQNFMPNGEAGAINQDGNTGWTVKYDTVTRNRPGAGVIAAADNTVQDDCLSYNGQYGFQSSQRNGFGKDSLTGGPYNVNIKNNEIDFNDTCDWEGTLNNSAVGWTNYNPVPAANRPSDCGTVNPNGNSGGFKLWQTNGVTISGNYIHDNYGPGGWVDTDNANTTFDSNYISGNDDDAIIEEISYNFSITNNTLVKNDIIGGLANAGFPQPAIYVSESGSDTTFGGIPACGETSCSDQSSYKTQSVISGNVLTDNGGGVFLWSDSNRYCSDGFDDGCTLVDGGASGPFTEANCTTNWPAASENTTTWAGNTTGSPAEDWYDGCLWKTENVSVTSNTINFTPANLTLNGSGVCNSTDWSDCGANGVFSEYGSPPNKQPGWVIPTAITFHQGNSWSSNTYNGPSTFYAWNQGNGDNPVSWANWTGATSGGDECSSSGEQTSGACTGPFGQDSGSTFNGSGTSSAPAVSTSAATGVTSSGATLNGTVNPEGQSTTYQFDYGTTTSYGSSTPSPAGSAGSGSTAVSESATLTGLTANTTYHYRIEATNATGTTFGSDQTFTTSASGGSAVSFDAAASGGNTGSRSLSWTQAVSGSSRAIEVGVTVGGDSTQTVTVKDGTTSMTALTGKLNSNNATSGFLQVFGLANPPAGTNTITVTVSGGSVPDAVTGGSISYDGVSQTSPFGTAKTLTGAGIDPSITTTGSTSGDMESGFLSDGSAVASATSGTSRYIVDEDNNTAAGNGAGATAASTGSNVTFTWSDTDDWWAAATVEVQHA